MSISALSIIGESINDSVPSTHAMFDAEDMEGLLELARTQAEAGAAYIDVNVGARSPDFMAQIVHEIKKVTCKPLSVDSPDLAVAQAGLSAYYQENCGGEKPILNSISALRTEMFSLYKATPFRPILIITENVVNGQSCACHTAEETYQAAKDMLHLAHETGIPNSDCIFDPGIAPLGSDTEDNLKRLLDALTLIHDDPDFAGVHASVGLSNFTVMLPAKRPDGSLVKGPLESAFLTRAMPLGLDYVIGSVKRNYNLLEPDHPAMRCVDDCLALGGFESIMRVRDFYTGMDE